MQRLLIASIIVLASSYKALATPVPDTGQKKCYDNTQEITCPNPGEDFYGQDAQYITNPHSYTKLDANGNDLPDNAPWPWAMVRDNITGLVWEVKNSKDNVKDYGNANDADNTYTWDAAMEFGTTLNAQTFGGYSDWRLPTIKELSSLIDSNIPVPAPPINTFYFPNTNNSSLSYWSSIPCVADPTRAWIVSFYDGVVGRLLKSNGRFVRAVHGGENGSYGDFIVNGNGTVTDNGTGLIWQMDTAPGTYNWQQALYYCDNFTLGGHDDWRLPNRNELQTLVDYNRYNPSIDTG